MRPNTHWRLSAITHMGESSFDGWRTDASVDLLHDVSHKPRRTTMLYTIAVVLIILWALGLVSAYTMGGFIHVLLVIAVVVILLRVISGRSPV